MGIYKPLKAGGEIKEISFETNFDKVQLDNQNAVSSDNKFGISIASGERKLTQTQLKPLDDLWSLFALRHDDILQLPGVVESDQAGTIDFTTPDNFDYFQTICTEHWAPTIWEYSASRDMYDSEALTMALDIYVPKDGIINTKEQASAIKPIKWYSTIAYPPETFPVLQRSYGTLNSIVKRLYDY